MEEYSLDDPTQLLEASSEFANYPGVQNDDSAKEFLDRFPLLVILNALQTKADVPGLENTLVDVLESIFKSRYGASLIPQYMSFIQVGLAADSQKVKSLACKTVTHLLESVNGDAVCAHLIVDNNIYPLLLDCLINGNEQVTTLATEAITKIAGSPTGMDKRKAEMLENNRYQFLKADELEMALELEQSGQRFMWSWRWTPPKDIKSLILFPVNCSNLVEGSFLEYYKMSVVGLVSKFGESWKEKTEFIRQMDWGMNTDFQKVFDVFLEVAVMIKRLCVCSDMGFDQVSANDVIMKKFKEAGYGEVIPQLVSWNLNLRHSKSIHMPGNQKGTALLKFLYILLKV